MTPSGIELETYWFVGQCLQNASQNIWLYPKYEYKGGGTAIPVHARTGPEVSRSFSLPDFKTIGT